MKKILSLLLFLITFTTAYAAVTVNQIVFFGDSLTDNGNLYKAALHFIPKSPPYFDGRFSNGPAWSENVSRYYYDKYYIDSKNYAWGGATVVFHLPNTKFISTSTLETQLNSYLTDSIFKDRSKAFYIFWLGNNDYIFNADADPNSATARVVNRIEWGINKLKSRGGKNFLLLNLVDSSRTPQIDDPAKKEKLHNLVVMHNQKLDAMVQKLKKENPDLLLLTMDVYSVFNDFMDHPEIYNEKYHTHVTNTTEACWKGGYWLQQRLLSTESMKAEITQSIFNELGYSRKVDAEIMSNTIVNSPELSYTYLLGKSYAQGNVPCNNADEHLFWDSIHPTDIVHNVFAQMVEDVIGDQITG